MVLSDVSDVFSAAVLPENAFVVVFYLKDVCLFGWWLAAHLSIQYLSFNCKAVSSFGLRNIQEVKPLRRCFIARGRSSFKLLAATSNQADSLRRPLIYLIFVSGSCPCRVRLQTVASPINFRPIIHCSFPLTLSFFLSETWELPLQEQWTLIREPENWGGNLSCWSHREGLDIKGQFGTLDVPRTTAWEKKSASQYNLPPCALLF